MKFLNLLFLVVFGLTGTINSGHAQEFNNAQQAFIDNLLKNPGAETGGKDFVAYADAAAVTPVDGTGGSPTVTCESSASSPLKGKRSFLITKPASNVQGQGCSIDVTIPAGYQTQFLKTVFMKSTSANYADGDIRMYAYDVTGGGSPIEFDTRDVAAGSSDYLGGFQVPSGSVTIRLIFHVATTNASAYTVTLDQIVTDKLVGSKGLFGTDEITFTPSISWTGAVSSTGTIRFIGQMAIIKWLITASGAPTGTNLDLTLPFGLSIDTSKLSHQNIVSDGTYYDATGYNYPLRARYLSATSVRLRYYDDGASGLVEIGNVNPTNPQTVATGDSFEMTITVPIVGRSSNMSLAEDGGTRKVGFKAYRTAAQTGITNAETKIDFNAVMWDYTSSFSTTGNRYYAPESGDYQCSYALSVYSGTSGDLNYSFIRKNGSSAGNNRFAQDEEYFASAGAGNLTGSAVVPLLKDEYIDVAIDSTTDNSFNVDFPASASYFECAKIPSPQTVAGGATHSARYENNAGSSIASGATNALPWPTLKHNSGIGTMDGSGNFTLAMGGKFVVCTGAYINDATSGWNGTTERMLMIITNSTTTENVGRAQLLPPVNAQSESISFCSPPFIASKGDVIVSKLAQESGNSLLLTTTAGYTFFGIQWVGNQ